MIPGSLNRPFIVSHNSGTCEELGRRENEKSKKSDDSAKGHSPYNARLYARACRMKSSDALSGL